MRLPQGAEWFILLLIVVVLFGAKRLPDAARGLGRSLRIFKAETKALTEDGGASSVVAADAPEVSAQLPATPPPAASPQISASQDAPPIGTPASAPPPASQPRA